MKKLQVLFLLFLVCTLQSRVGADQRPNVLVIMVDDLGYSDIGCYGSEIETPHLDRLASNGLRFSQFYNTAKCHSSRVSLLTGQYCFAAGNESMTHAVTSAEVLNAAGYFTAMTGKWHLRKQPTDFGFSRYFGHLSGACNYFTGDKTFRLNGQPWRVPEKGFYTTVAKVDYGLQFLNEARKTGKPWYLYVAFNAPHAPLHALPEDYAKYKGKYLSGWDKVRQSRFAKQKQLGVLPKTLRASPRPEHVPSWTEMDSWKRDYEAKRMSTLAAMIDRVDQEVGRLLGDLKKNKELENTFILFVSDNGACPYDRRKPRLEIEPTNENDSFGDSTGWSWARNTPFRYYKQNQFEGGISTPAIVHWPAGIKRSPGTVVHQPAHLIDVLPTLADITASKIPTSWQGRELRPISGISLKPILYGQALSREKPIHFMFSSDRGLRDGDWKLVSFRKAPWELYNLSNDRAELKDLAGEEPERLKRMIQTWHQMANDVLHATSSLQAPVGESKSPHIHPEWTNFAAKTAAEYPRRGRKSSNTRRTGRRRRQIRARKNTQLTIKGNQLHLEFTGEDPGIAMDLRGTQLSNGPYRVTFELSASKNATGDIFFTTNPNRTLPKGKRVEFKVKASESAMKHVLVLNTQQRLYQLRIDVAAGPGKATISNLKLTDKDGKILKSWPPRR